MSNGELHLIIGCMFSGKTTELLRIAKRYKSINKNVLLLNYDLDKRYSNKEMMTHDKTGLPCLFYNKLLDIINIIEEYEIICINEGQFFEDLIDFCKECLKNNKILYVCGLDGDYKQEPFGDILNIIPLCDSIVKLHAFCKICNNQTPAFFTKRITNDKEQKLIGTEQYVPVCRKHID